MQLLLPYPPSANKYWRHVGAKVLISREGRAFRADVSRVEVPKRMVGRLSVTLEVHPPDRRRRDLDNVCKSTLDALQYAGAYIDDSQIDRLLVIRRQCCDGGKLVVTLEEMEHGPNRAILPNCRS